MDQQLEAIRKEIRDLHDCLDGMRDEQQDLKHDMSNYFLGVEPNIHVRHHNDLTDRSQAKTETSRVSKETIGIILAALVINVSGMIWMNTNIVQHLNPPTAETKK